MLITVIGASASGKSSFAESLIKKYKGDRFYIATMACMDEESKERIKKHQAARSDKGFFTIECPTNINNAFVKICKKEVESALVNSTDVSDEGKQDDLVEYAGQDKSKVVLLECMSNLLANEKYDEKGNCKDKEAYFEEIDNWIISPIEAFIKGKESPKGESFFTQEICNACKTEKVLIVVTGEVFMDGYDYDAETLRYMEGLGKINSRLVELSDEAYEVVCGIPVRIK